MKSRPRVTVSSAGRCFGLRARKLRAALSALGIAIGIAAGVAVLGISASSRASLLSELGAEANLLTVSAGQTVDGTPAALPLTAEPMIARIPPVESVTAVGYVPGRDRAAHRMVPAIDSGGISVLAAQPGCWPRWAAPWRTARSSTRRRSAIPPWCSARWPRRPSASTWCGLEPRSTWAAGTSR